MCGEYFFNILIIITLISSFLYDYIDIHPPLNKDELKENSWLIQEIDSETLFSREEEDLWKRILKASDKRIARMADYPEDPSLN